MKEIKAAMQNSRVPKMSSNISEEKKSISVNAEITSNG